MHKIGLTKMKLVGLTQKSLEQLAIIKTECGCQTDSEAMRQALRLAAGEVEK